MEFLETLKVVKAWTPCENSSKLFCVNIWYIFIDKVTYCIRFCDFQIFFFSSNQKNFKHVIPGVVAGCCCLCSGGWCCGPYSEYLPNHRITFVPVAYITHFIPNKPVFLNGYALSHYVPVQRAVERRKPVPGYNFNIISRCRGTSAYCASLAVNRISPFLHHT